MLWKPLSWKAVFIRADGQMDMTNLIVDLCNFANSPESNKEDSIIIHSIETN